jgi:hypothetical protein
VRLTEDALRRRVGALPLLRQTLLAAAIGFLRAPLAGFGWLLNVLPRLVTHGIARRLVREQIRLARQQLARDQDRMRRFLLEARPAPDAAGRGRAGA